MAVRSVSPTRSSASRHSTQSCAACSMANCFWLRKPSNGRCRTLAPIDRAISTVASVECESTTTTSSQKASEAMQSPMRSASLNAIMQAESGQADADRSMGACSPGACAAGDADEDGEEALMADYLLFASERY